VYSRLKFFTCCLTYSNLYKFMPSRFFDKVNRAKWKWPILFSFIQYIIALKIPRKGAHLSSERKAHDGLHFYFFSTTQYNVYSEEYTDTPSENGSNAVSGFMNVALHMKDLVVTFVMTADTDFDIFNSIFIAWVTHPLCPKRSGKADSFSFLCFN